MEYIVLDPTTGPHTAHTNDRIARFLEDHLDRFGDRKEDILKCLAYVFDERRGGFVVIAVEGDAILGAVVVNETGMGGYIPENILVYIAVDRKQRGRGLGKGLMMAAMEKATGAIALHVEPDNPAKKLYEALGFTNKYLEMRLHR
ncbi:MAG: GNAT family N-acetyltransferase [Flavobacteriales bacterium]|nr:GNAT family N-acetyltransferase [Flavobacteriales bacterium]